jgi:hypothetical protein
MLIQVHRIDSDGFYIEPVLIEQNDVIEDENIVTVDPPEGLYKPRWLNGEWTEGLSQEEIDAIRNKPQPASEVDDLKQQLADVQIALADIMGV